jgi:hypothetical protein
MDEMSQWLLCGRQLAYHCSKSEFHCGDSPGRDGGKPWCSSSLAGQNMEGDLGSIANVRCLRQGGHLRFGPINSVDMDNHQRGLGAGRLGISNLSDARIAI